MESKEGTSKSVAFVTLGCAKNEADSDKMAQLLKRAGYEISGDPETADAVIVNTCSFIQAATEESIEAILDAAGMDNIANGSAKLLVAGCMPARYKDDLAMELPEVDSFISCSEEADIVARLDALFGLKRMYAGVDSRVVQDSGTDDFLVSAYVKISDGCDRFCSYCTIPFIRGRYHSYPLDDICNDIDGYIARGAREIILIAQDTGRWGADFEEPSSLAKLLETLAQRYPDVWIRVMYIQPEGITDELLDVVSSHDNICKYFDIPLQHVDASILKSMNRHGSLEEYERLIERIKTAVPGAVLRTTLIAGYPGETEEQFEALCDFVEEAPFDYVGVFAYSQEEGTRAAKMDCQIDEDEKLARAQQLRDIADAVCTQRIAERIGSTVQVIVCGEEEDGQLYGRAMSQAPDVDGVTYLDAGDPGECVTVTVDDVLLYEMEGSVILRERES